MNQIVFSFTVFPAGILSFFSPCVFPLLPVYIGVLLGSDQEKSVQIFGKKIRWHGIVKTLCFIAGISVIFLIIGFGAGLLGQVMYTNWFRYVMGALIIILGLHQMEVFHFSFLEKQKTMDFGANKHKNELPYFNRLKPHLLLLKKIGGAIIIIMGILLLLGQLNSLSSIFS